MEIFKPSKNSFKKVIEIIKNGGVVVLPTDTVYGLVCDATNKKAVEKIFKIKKRSKTKPLPVFVKDMKMAKELTEIDEKQIKILKNKWPGKYTFVLKSKIQNPNFKTNSKSKIQISKLAIAKDKTIALRIPKYRFLNNLFKKINKPLAQTSANISDYPATTKIKEAIKYFKEQKIQPDIIIDGGDLKKNKPSVIIDLTKDNIKILRK